MLCRISLASLVGLLLVVSGCDQGGSAPTALAVATPEGAKLVVEEAVLADLFTDVEGPMPKAPLGEPIAFDPSAPAPQPLDYRFDTYSVEGSGNTFYAVASGATTDGNCFTTARRLESTGDQIGLIAYADDGSIDSQSMFGGEEHTCTGVGCENCDFTYEDDGVTIDGCTCPNPLPGGRCDHTVKTVSEG